MSIQVTQIAVPTICCAICREAISLHPAALAERKIYSFDGELKAIELAHRDCVLGNSLQDLVNWQFDGD